MKKLLIFFLGSVFIVVLLVVGASLLLRLWLTNSLPDMLNQNENRTYNITFESVNLNLFAKQLLVEGVSVLPLKIDSIHSEVRINRLIISNPNLRKLIGKEAIITKKLVVEEPRVEFFGGVVSRGGERINEIWSDVFTRLQIETLEIKMGSLMVGDPAVDAVSYGIADINLLVEGFRVDTSTMKNPLPLKYREIYANFNNVHFYLDTLYHLNFDKLELSNTHFNIWSVSLNPLLTKEEFMNVSRAKNDWLKLSADKLGLEGFSWKYRDGAPYLMASKIKVDSMVVHAFADNNYPKDLDSARLLLADLMHKVPFVFALDSIELVNSSIQFESITPKQSSRGSIVIDKLYSTGYNLHNDSSLFKTTEFDIIARFMQQAQLKAALDFNVNDKSNRFEFSGSLDNLTAASVNEILDPLAGIETAGQLYGIDFYMLADDNKASGIVNFEYSDLEVKILRRNKSGEEDVLLSALTNIALRKNNIFSDKRFKQGGIDVDRDPEKAVFGYLWEALKDGLLDTIVPFDLDKEKRKQKRQLWFQKIRN